IQNVNDFILTKIDIEKLSKTVKIKEPKPELDLIQYQLNLNELITKVNSVLVREPEKQDVISVLEGNLDALEWTRKGLELNEPDNNCLFCDNPISHNRIELLNRFYANEGAKLRKECKPLLEAILKHEEDISKLNFPPSIQDINEGLQDQYIKQKKRVDRSLTVYQNKLVEVRQKLIDKEHKYVYQSVSEIQEFDCVTLGKELADLNDIIKSNNDFSSNFQNLIETERLKYINHLVAKFLKDNKYVAKQKKHDHAITEIEKLDEKISQHLKEIERLNALKNSGEEGCQQFNYFIQSFLGKEDIEIKFNDAKKKFNLYRGKEIAKHLSEGEKMAISFSHFMVSLKAIETKGELVNTIIYIDDPISSLDGNHVFQINAMLKDFLFEKVPDPNNGSQQMWNQKCMQLFISTHNYEFFNLLKEMPVTSGYKFSRKPSSKESRYFISRKLNSSEIVDLPKVYNDFKSEYHYLFQQIYEFSEEAPSEKVIIMPNVLRRFLEIYTLAKYPSTDEVDDRATEIWNSEISKRICKPFHFFSHFNNIDRIGQHSELLADINAACKELIKQLKKDKIHYTALKATL
ncbi:MAG: AAA family ATPase, partial [Crocinitomicaceae bacterium]|nr:AAA family ATPase [Crocinitomicaceae bacterium]